MGIETQYWGGKAKLRPYVQDSGKLSQDRRLLGVRTDGNLGSRDVAAMRGDFDAWFASDRFLQIRNKDLSPDA